MAGLLLHQFQVSPFAAKVRRALYFKGLEFEVVNYAAADVGRIRRTISPSGKTPVLEHDGNRIVDSTAILRHLEREFPAPPLLPEDPAQRAQVHILEDWADESLFFYDLVMRSWPNNVGWLLEDVLSHDRGVKRWLLSRLLPGALRKGTAAQGLGRKDPATICAEVRDHFDALVALLGEREWLVGEQISLADIAVASMCTVIDRAEEAAAMLRDRTSLMAWLERVNGVTLPPGTSPADAAIT